MNSIVNNDLKSSNPDNIEQIIVSEEKGTESDMAMSISLEKAILKDFIKTVPEELKDKIKEVLNILSEIIKEWMCLVFKKKHPSNSEEDAKNAIAKLFLSGSFILGVFGSSSDIDTLLVAPRYVDRNEHFFGDLLDILKKSKHISGLKDIRGAYVPIIKMNIKGIDFDNRNICTSYVF